MNEIKWMIYCLIILAIAMGFVIATYAHADYWIPLPPYNVLWPLWSPALSPIDPVTGIPTPIVTSLTANTLLPVQPGMAWDPATPEVNNTPYPWLLYNAPASLGGGLLYWDQFYGMRPWPPNYMIDPVALVPIPIALPIGYELLKPIEYGDIWAYNYLLGNAAFSNIFGLPPAGLLTPAMFWGFPPLALPLDLAVAPSA